MSAATWTMFPLLEVGWHICCFPALVVDFLPFFLLPFSSLWYFRELLPSLITRSYDLNLRTNTRYVGVPFPTTCCDRRSCSVRRITSRLVGSSPCICVCAKSYSVFPLRLSACKNWLIFFFFCLLHCCKLSVVAVAFRR